MFTVLRSTEWKQKKLKDIKRGRGTEVGKTAVTAPGYYTHVKPARFGGRGGALSGSSSSIRLYMSCGAFPFSLFRWEEYAEVPKGFSLFFVL